MEDFNCGTGCLRMELDENRESLVDFLDSFAECLESDEVILPDDEEMKNFKVLLDSFGEDLHQFRTNCGRCKNFETNGKASELGILFDKANKLWLTLKKKKTFSVLPGVSAESKQGGEPC